MKGKILKINFFRFVNNKLLLFAMLIFIISSIGYLMLGLYQDLKAGDDLFQFVYTLWYTNIFSIYSFAFFLLITYEFCSKLHTNKLYETIYCSTKGLWSTSFYNILTLTIFDLIYSVLLFMYNCIVFIAIHSFEEKYIVHIFLNILINIFLVNLLAIVFGTAVSFLKNKALSYMIIVVFLILGSKIGESIAGAVVISTNNSFNAFKIFNIFNIFPPNMGWTPTYAMGFSILPYRIVLILVWVAMFFTILLWCMKTKQTKITASFTFCIAMLLAIQYFQPESKLVLNSDPDGEALGDQYYYLDYSGENVEATFNVEKYVLNIKIDREFNCSATVVLDSSTNECCFTLYHGYRINTVMDQNGEQLTYNRIGDYLEVFSEKNIEYLIIDYSGTGKGFYSNVQGIYLPGDFPYYPVAGKKKIYDDNYYSVTADNIPQFDIVVSSNLQIHSNLNSNAENVFSGKTKVPCLFAGLLTSYEYKGLTIVYPYLYGETIYLDQILCNIDIDSFYGKTIFLEPHVNISYDTYMREYEDVVLTPDFGGLINAESED